MRFFVDDERRLVRTHDSVGGYPFSSYNWREVTPEEYDAFRKVTASMKPKELRKLRGFA